jgi:predicted nucleic acid-binding Zn ribbon protein
MVRASPEHIKNIIGHILGGEGLRQANEQNRISSAWAKAVGKKTLAHARISSARENKIVVIVDSSGWLYQLNLDKEKISKKLNAALGKEEPFKIYFRLGEV